MVDAKLVKWIKNAEVKGYSESQLRTFLAKKGYKKSDIDNALNNTQNNVQTSSSETMDFWDKLKYLLSSPNIFFDKIKSEKGIKNAFLTLAIVLLSVSVVSYGISFTIFHALSYGSLFAYGLVGFFSTTFIVISFVLSLLMSFVYSGIVHLLVIGFKGEGNYAETYKAYVYSFIPFQILILIPLVGFLSIIYSFILMIIGVAKLHNISKGKAALACLLPVVFIIGTIIIFAILFLRYFLRGGF